MCYKKTCTYINWTEEELRLEGKFGRIQFVRSTPAYQYSHIDIIDKSTKYIFTHNYCSVLVVINNKLNGSQLHKLTRHFIGDIIVCGKEEVYERVEEYLNEKINSTDIRKYIKKHKNLSIDNGLYTREFKFNFRELKRIRNRNRRSKRFANVLLEEVENKNFFNSIDDYEVL